MLSKRLLFSGLLGKLMCFVVLFEAVVGLAQPKSAEVKAEKAMVIPLRAISLIKKG